MLEFAHIYSHAFTHTENSIPSIGSVEISLQQLLMKGRTPVKTLQEFKEEMLKYNLRIFHFTFIIYLKPVKMVVNIFKNLIEVNHI